MWRGTAPYHRVQMALMDAADAAELAADPRLSARAAGLRYSNDAQPGYRRRRRGSGWEYLDEDGATLHDAEQVQRIHHLAIPPAWTDVWICRDPRGHLQATGRDARGRKQYRYHPRWREVRDETKYGRMAGFAEVLPRIRRRVSRDLGRDGLVRDRVLASIVRLLDTTYLRVGNEEYAKENRSFGLTTLRDRHVEVDGSMIHLEFRGKSGKMQEVDVRDRRVAKVVKRLQDLPGHELFQYCDEDGSRRPVTSDDVNDYIRDAAGDDYTAKDFRTWAGTVLAAWALRGLGEHTSERQAKHQLTEAIAETARALGNTPAVCRRCYVHPEVISAHLDGSLLRDLAEAEEELRESRDDLSPRETAVLKLLRSRLAASPSAA